ncbi:craniofacial development protein 2 [Elysia marginata]|uniref:Craniofacial development protein 2 n=1 Tax=Elysia marginata TaxID=1093978 RepID=A0AAV4GFD1_9GAST|nr:craniofacial development protein 2 [Elysia marginata]
MYSNSTIARSQVQDEKGGGLGVGLATPSCKITNGTETVEERNSTLGGRSKAGQLTGIMMGGDESRGEVSTLTAGLLMPKQSTLYIRQVSYLKQSRKSTINYALELLGIVDARWTKTSKQRLGTGETIIWSGRQDGDHQEGVAVILSKKHANSIIQWEPINERLFYIRLNSKFAKTSIVVGYAPTDVAENEDKNQFYFALQELWTEYQGYDVLLLMGDFNAKIGNKNINKEKIMGRHGIGDINV